jgi:hypothetical protein
VDISEKLDPVSGSKNIKRGGRPDSDLNFLWSSGQSGKGVEWSRVAKWTNNIIWLPTDAKIMPIIFQRSLHNSLL